MELSRKLRFILEKNFSSSSYPHSFSPDPTDQVSPGDQDPGQGQLQGGAGALPAPHPGGAEEGGEEGGEGEEAHQEDEEAKEGEEAQRGREDQEVQGDL